VCDCKLAAVALMFHVTDSLLDVIHRMNVVDYCINILLACAQCTCMSEIGITAVQCSSLQVHI
jgi:hypothetical protein